MEPLEYRFDAASTAKSPKKRKRQSRGATCATAYMPYRVCGSDRSSHKNTGEPLECRFDPAPTEKGRKKEREPKSWRSARHSQQHTCRDIFSYKITEEPLECRFDSSPTEKRRKKRKRQSRWRGARDTHYSIHALKSLRLGQIFAGKHCGAFRISI